MILINKDLPQKLAEFKKATDESRLSVSQLLFLACELIDAMETELICEGLLDANP